jgi:hypothetical protein
MSGRCPECGKSVLYWVVQKLERREKDATHLKYLLCVFAIMLVLCAVILINIDQALRDGVIRIAPENKFLWWIFKPDAK